MPKKRYTAAFKSKVALEAHPNQVSQWKRQLRDGLEDIFTGPSKSNRSEEKEKDRLYQEIGRLKVELDWIKKKL